MKENPPTEGVVFESDSAQIPSPCLLERVSLLSRPHFLFWKAETVVP